MQPLFFDKPVKNSNGRNGFDLSSTHAFSSRPAVLRPVVFQDTVPNSSYRINVSDLIRTSALQTAAFLRGKQELDFYFVPYSLVTARANDIILGNSDDVKPYLQNISSRQFQTVSLNDLLRFAVLPYVYSLFYNSRDYLMNNVMRPNGSAYASWYYSKPYVTAAYWLCTHILPQLDFGRSSYIYDMMSLCSYNYYVAGNSISAADAVEPASLSLIGSDVLSILDTCGYGSFIMPFKAVFDQYNSQCAALSEEEKPQETVYFNRLGELLHAVIDFNTSNVNPYRLFVYQKIFYDRYRDSVIDNEPQRYMGAVSMDYDFSDYVQSLVDMRFESINPLFTWLRPRTRMFKKDLLSALYPSPQFGQYASTVDLDRLSNYESIAVNSADTADGSNVTDSRSALNMRFALALQKYKETLLRAGNRTKDLLKAEFGVESRYVDDNYVRYLGSFDGVLELNKVSATAETGSYSVGDLAANMFSSLNGNTIEFTCNDYGVIVGVFSVIPEVLHNSYGLDPFVLKSGQFDYFHDAFENLGLQVVSSEVASMLNFDNAGGSSNVSTLGFSARYNEYKQNLDKAHDLFQSSIPRYRIDDRFALYPTDGMNSNYVLTRSVLSDLDNTVNRNYLLPDCFDNIFQSLDYGLPESSHFDIILDVNITAVLPMSVIGLP